MLLLMRVACDVEEPPNEVAVAKRTAARYVAPAGDARHAEDVKTELQPSGVADAVGLVQTYRTHGFLCSRNINRGR